MSDLSFEDRLRELDDDRDEMELLKTVAKKMLRQNSADHDEKDNKNDK
jgi:hypothetical protein